MTLFPIAVVEMSLGFQQVKLGERGGRRRDFNDTGINTRQTMEHVKESKTGLLNSIFFHIRHILYAMTLMLTFSVCLVFLQEQVALSFR